MELTDELRFSGDPQKYAQERLALSFKDILLGILREYKKAKKKNKKFAEYIEIGGGMSLEDMIKCVEDQNEQGKALTEQFRQLTEAELISRGIFPGGQVEKKIEWY
jgi:hypothetical protein